MHDEKTLRIVTFECAAILAALYQTEEEIGPGPCNVSVIYLGMQIGRNRSSEETLAITKLLEQLKLITLDAAGITLTDLGREMGKQAVEIFEVLQSERMKEMN